MKIGWHPDPDDADVRRYWDGEERSAPSPTSGSSEREQLGPTAPSKAAWQILAEQRGTAITPASCAAAGCSEPRFNGKDFCLRHGPSRRSATTRPPSSSLGGSAAIVCPHCQVQGRVTSRKVRQQKGVSGAKATGAVLTAGISIGTGLSRKETVTRDAPRQLPDDLDV